VVNFIAAYGTHGTVTAATTLAGKRAWRQRMAEIFLANLESMACICRAYGIKGLFILQPSRLEAAARLDPTLRGEHDIHLLEGYELFRRGLHGLNIRFGHEPATGSPRDFQQLLPETVCALTQFPGMAPQRFEDMSRIYDRYNLDDVYWDGVHPYDDRTGIVAERIVQLLREGGYLP